MDGHLKGALQNNRGDHLHSASIQTIEYTLNYNPIILLYIQPLNSRRGQKITSSFEIEGFRIDSVLRLLRAATYQGNFETFHR